MPRPPLHPSTHDPSLVPAWTRASSVRHLRNGLIFLFVVCLFAVVGYVLVGWTWLEAIYMATITVFTVGYEEPVPVESPGLRIFTIFFILLGCTGYLYIGSALVQFLVEGHIENLLGKRRMGKSIHNLKNHTIVCGYGRVGRMLSAELHSAGHDFVIIDRDETQVTSIHEKGFLFLQEDATEEESLVEAGIGKAKQIAVVLADDAANVFITLSARNLNEDVNIIARGMAPTTVGKLKQAGANQVILPEHIAAERIASIVLRPITASLHGDGTLLTQMTSDFADLGLQAEEFLIPAESNLAGLTLADLETKGSSSFLVVTILRASGEAIRKPRLDTVLYEGDSLVIICHKGDAPEFARMFDVKTEDTPSGEKAE